MAQVRRAAPAGILITFFVALAGCANPYRANLIRMADAYPDWTATRLADPPKTPQLRISDDIDGDKRALFQSGHVLIGRARFTGQTVDMKKAMREGRRIGAHVVVVERRFVGTVTQRVAHTGWTPATTTEVREEGRHVVGENVARYDRRVEVRSGGDPYTLFLPREVQQYDQSATYWRRVQAPVIGLLVRNLTTEERRAIGQNAGLAVVAVMNASPAFEADFFEGDIITTWDGERPPVARDFYENIMRWAGEEVPVSLVRDGQRVDVAITLNP